MVVVYANLDISSSLAPLVLNVLKIAHNVVPLHLVLHVPQALPLLNLVSVHLEEVSLYLHRKYLKVCSSVEAN